MGVMVGGEWHEELADPGGGEYASGADYNKASSGTSWGQNLNTQYSTSAGPGNAGNPGGGIDSILQALQAGDQRTFDEMVRQFSLTFGLDEKKFGEDVRQFNESLQLQQAGLTGMYQGAATLPALTSYATQFGTWGTPQQGAQTLASRLQQAQLYGMESPAANAATLEAQRQWAELYGANAAPGAGQETLASQQQRYAQQMGMINQAATLQANPFRQQQAIGQMGNLLGGRGVAGFSAPNTVAGVGTAGGNTQGGLGYLSQMIEDIRNPAANTASMNEVMNAIPTPTKLNSTEFLRSAPSTQNMVLQGMSEKFGLDPQDALRQIQSTLPQFQSPTTFGGVKR